VPIVAYRLLEGFTPGAYTFILSATAEVQDVDAPKAQNLWLASPEARAQAFDR